jgi:centromere/kinetochore protein ZW10
MTSPETSVILEEPGFEERLRKVKEEVKKATKEALSHAGATEPRSLPENDDPNASFHLGMELFGQEVSVLERTVQEKLRQMERDVEDIMEEVQQEDPSANQSQESAQTPEDIEEESKMLKGKILFLRECSSARSLVDESITSSTPALSPNEEPDLPLAAKKLVQARQSLDRAQKILEAEEERDSKSPALGPGYTIVDSVCSSLRRQKVDLIGKAKSLWHTCVSLTPNTLSVRAPDGLNAAYDVLEAFEEDGSLALQETLRSFTRSLHQDVFSPLLENHRTGKPKTSWSFNETEDRGSSSSFGKAIVSSGLTKGPIRKLEWTCEEEDILGSSVTGENESFGVAPWKDTFAALHRVLVFAAEHALQQREPLCSYAASRLFGKPTAAHNALHLEALGLESCRIGDDNGLLLHPLIEALEKTCVPRYLKAADLGQLQVMAEELNGFIEPFLQELNEKNLLPLEGKTRLATFAAEFEQKYIDNRRCVVLNEGRNLLTKNDYHNTVEVGEDVCEKNKPKGDLGDGLAVFKLHKSSVSDTAFKLMELCRRTMDEAVEQKAAPTDSPLAVLPAVLYRTARELLDLFRAIIPVTHGHEIANVPRTAAVLHNDCVFFAHHCLSLGLEYKERFPPPEPDDSRGNLLRQTCMFVDMVPLFRDLADRSLGDMLDLQKQQIVELVGSRIILMEESLRSDEILAEWSDAEAALTAGVYHVRHLCHAWKPVLSYDVWNRSICFLADVIFSLFLDQVAKAKDISLNACQFLSTLFQKASQDLGELVEGDKSGSRLWGRFSAVGKFMDMSLADIQVALSDGVFRDVTGPELSRLLKSCFDDSPKRQNLLNLLSANQ